MKNNKSDYILGILLTIVFIIVKLTFLSVGYSLLLLPLGLPELSLAHLFGILLYIINLSGNKFNKEDKREIDVKKDNENLKKYIIFYLALTLTLFILSLFI